MRLGIDFGTTNSAAVVYDGHTLTSIDIFSPEKSAILPSLIYINREHQAKLGLDAGREYAQRETGRPVRWRSKRVGVIETWFASTGSSPILVAQDIVATYDEAAYGRLLQSVKTALRNDFYGGTQIFDRFYPFDELIALLLKRLKDSAEKQLKQTCDEVVIGRPVKFSDRPGVSMRAEEIIYKAARLAGFKDIAFHAEPVGAMYVYHIAATERKLALVFDFGGGTLDLTIAEVGAGITPNILATRGVLVGGDDLDRRIMQSLFKYFGDDPTRDIMLPHDFLELLNNWQTMPELSRPQHADMLRDLRLKSKYPQTIDALETLVSKNLGYALFSAIEEAKCQLTSSLTAELKFEYENIHIRERITRTQFEAMIRPEVKQVREGIDHVLEDAGVAADQIDVVLRTGGSSLVPAFVNMLADMFGRGKLHEMDALISVVGGLGIIAREDAGLRGDYRCKYVENPAEVIMNIKANGEAAYRPYFMRVGVKCYVDQDTMVRKIPVELNQLPAIMTAYLDRENSDDELLQFRLPYPAKVYIAYQASALQLPHWLEDFTRQDNLTLEIESEWWGVKELFFYSKTFPAGEVVLGGNAADGFKGKNDTTYLVVVERLTS